MYLFVGSMCNSCCIHWRWHGLHVSTDNSHMPDGVPCSSDISVWARRHVYRPHVQLLHAVQCFPTDPGGDGVILCINAHLAWYNSLSLVVSCKVASPACKMLPVATDVAHSLCVCILGTWVSCAKTAEPIEMQFFGGWFLWIQLTMY